MAVTFDNSVSATTTTATVTTGNFTIGSGANRVAFLALCSFQVITNITCSVGGVAGVEVAACQLTAQGTDIHIYIAVNPPSGTQNATASWTTAGSTSLAVMTFAGVNQASPSNNPATTAGGASPQSLQITSTNGDLTVTCCGGSSGDQLQTSNQTLRQQTWGSVDTGPGTGTTTHTWTDVGSNLPITGLNLVAAAGGGLFVAGNPMTGLGVGGHFFSNPLNARARLVIPVGLQL